MRVSNWNPQKWDGELIRAAMDRLEKAAEVVADRARGRVPVGNISRPASGGKFWTERTPGSLKATIRVVKKHGSDARNVRVYAGTKKVYYARFVEFGTIKKSARPFLRPALNGSKAAIRDILKG